MPRSCSPSPSCSHFFAIEGGQHRPVGLAVDPGLDLVLQRPLAQVEMLRLAQLELGRARDGGARVDQVGRVELLGAVLALVAARLVIAAVGAGALDVAVGQEAVVGHREELALDHFLDEAVLGQRPGEMLGQPVVPRARRAAEMVEGEPEARGDLLLHLVHLGAIILDRLAGLGGGELGRGAVLVGGADEHDLVAAAAHVAGIEIRRKLASDQIAQMLDPVDVGDRRSDEYPRHAQ